METARINDVREFSSEKFLKKTLCSTDKSIINLLCFQAGQELALHKHPNSDEIFYIVEGAADMTVGQEKKTVGNNTVVLGPANIEHGIKNHGTTPLVVLAIQAPKP